MIDYEKRAFFVVWNREKKPPQHMHHSQGEAVNEARRLANKHPGESFFVLHAVNRVRKVDVETISLVDPYDDDLPF